MILVHRALDFVSKDMVCGLPELVKLNPSNVVADGPMLNANAKRVPMEMPQIRLAVGRIRPAMKPNERRPNKDGPKCGKPLNQVFVGVALGVRTACP